MPKKSVANIGHSALTDHRIPRIASQSPPQLAATPESREDLIYHTRSAQEPDVPPDLRTQALAYYEVSQVYPAFRQRGFALLEQAARELPGDPEVQEAYGLVLLLARPESPAEAAQVLQKAIDSGSTSVEVRTRLAKIRLKEGNMAAARQLYNEAIEADPYYTPAYLGLVYLHEVTGDVQSGIATLERILKYDAGNEEARKALADAKEGPP
jgi:tetratricopeptide (TPR) repeat protein